MIQEFKAFIMRGNIVDLAVAVILGAAFGLVVTTFTDGVLMALVAAIVGEPSFDSITIDIGDGVIRIGTFLTAVVNFLIIALSLFMVLKAIEKASNLRGRGGEADAETPAPSDETVLLTEIRDLLSAGRGQ
ncbi:MAG: large conductance mechanosensitive channel protein MscL [Acidimicrobiia bacterium]